MQPPTTMKVVRLALATFILFYTVVAGASPELERSQSEFITAADAFQSGQYDKALELYSAIEERGHESADLYFNLGNTYTRLSKPGLAIKAYREALYRAPGLPTLKPILSLFAANHGRHRASYASHDRDNLAFFHFQLSTGEKWGLLLAFQPPILGLLAMCQHLSNDWLRALRAFSFIIAVAMVASIIVELILPKSDLVVTSTKTEAGGLDAKSVTRFTLHEGTELRIHEIRDGYARVVLPNQMRAAGSHSPMLPRSLVVDQPIARKTAL